jgi:toxin ParE1/3/4
MTFWFHPEALAEYNEAAERYKGASLKLGHDFVNAIENAVETIVEHPTRYPPIERNVRRFLLKRFPYKMYYQHDEANQRIIIYAVMHVRRHPDYWKQRVVERE